MPGMRDPAVIQQAARSDQKMSLLRGLRSATLRSLPTLPNHSSPPTPRFQQIREPMTGSSRLGTLLNGQWTKSLSSTDSVGFWATRF